MGWMSPVLRPFPVTRVSPIPFPTFCSFSFKFSEEVCGSCELPMVHSENGSPLQKLEGTTYTRPQTWNWVTFCDPATQ